MQTPFSCSAADIHIWPYDILLGVDNNIDYLDHVYGLGVQGQGHAYLKPSTSRNANCCFFHLLIEEVHISTMIAYQMYVKTYFGI